MNNNNEHPLQSFFVGLGAIVVTLLMTSGEWDLFDFGVAASILAFGFAFLKAKKIVLSNKWEIGVCTLLFGMITTAVLIALISVTAVLLHNGSIAKVDAQTYELVFPTEKVAKDQLYKAQIYWQGGLLGMSLVVWGIIFSATSKHPTKNVPAFLVTLQALKDDAALKQDNRGARKLLVTELYSAREEHASEATWRSDSPSGKCPVQVMKDTEVAVFNHNAKQDRHYHARGTEIYIVIEGNMKIDIEHKDYDLTAGDMIIVNPKAVHEIKPQIGESFLCRVVTVNCGGSSDKYLA